MAELETKEDFLTCSKYRLLFRTEMGMEIVADMMLDLGVLDGTDDTPGAIALRNYGLRFLHKCGILQDHNIRGIIRKLFELPVRNLEGDHDGTE